VSLLDSLGRHSKSLFDSQLWLLIPAGRTSCILDANVLPLPGPSALIPSISHTQTSTAHHGFTSQAICPRPSPSLHT
jgi:hypothetical protein